MVASPRPIASRFRSLSMRTPPAATVLPTYELEPRTRKQQMKLRDFSSVPVPCDGDAGAAASGSRNGPANVIHTHVIAARGRPTRKYSNMEKLCATAHAQSHAQ